MTPNSARAHASSTTCSSAPTRRTSPSAATPTGPIRGAGDSEVALFDILKLYGNRITELHVRQSEGGTWTEVLGPGDIDYPAFVAALAEMDVRPHVVLEQAVEEGTPHTMDALAAHRQSLDYLREVFAPLFAS